MTFVLVLAAVLVGALAQRVTGMGFALAVAPTLVLLLGPFDGVLVVNLCAIVSASVVLARVRRHVEWRHYALLVVPALLAIVPGAWLATRLPGWVLEVGIAVLLLVALTTSLVISRTSVTVTGRVPTLLAGATSGFMNVTAGFGGPAVSVYAVLTRWPQAAFAATLQPYFLTIGAASLTSKLLMAPHAVIELQPWQWSAIIGSLVAGLVAGELVDSRIDARTARAAVVVIAYVSGVVTLVHGLAAA